MVSTCPFCRGQFNVRDTGKSTALVECPYCRRNTEVNLDFLRQNSGSSRKMGCLSILAAAILFALVSMAFRSAGIILGAIPTVIIMFIIFRIVSPKKKDKDDDIDPRYETAAILDPDALKSENSEELARLTENPFSDVDIHWTDVNSQTVRFTVEECNVSIGQETGTERKSSARFSDRTLMMILAAAGAVLLAALLVIIIILLL